MDLGAEEEALMWSWLYASTSSLEGISRESPVQIDGRFKLSSTSTWHVHLEPQIWPRILNSPLFCPSRHSRQISDFQNTQGIIFVVDSNDRERVSEAREELQRMLNEDELRDALLLVFANKQDLPNAMNAAEITDKLGLHSLRQRQWWVFPQRLLLSKFAERKSCLQLANSKMNLSKHSSFIWILDGRDTHYCPFFLVASSLRLLQVHPSYLCH